MGCSGSSAAATKGRVHAYESVPPPFSAKAVIGKVAVKLKPSKRGKVASFAEVGGEEPGLGRRAPAEAWAAPARGREAAGDGAAAEQTQLPHPQRLPPGAILQDPQTPRSASSGASPNAAPPPVWPQEAETAASASSSNAGCEELPGTTSATDVPVKQKERSPVTVTLISGAQIVFSDLEKVTRAVELRSRLQDLRPLPWCARYEILKGVDVIEDTELLEEDAYTAVVKRQPYVRGASKVVEVSEEGLAMKMVAEPDGQDYGWICYEAAPVKGELRWQVKAENFTGATLVGMTTNAQDLDHVPGRQREGVHLEYRRSGNVRFYADPASDQPVYYFKHAEIQTGDVVEFVLDTIQGTVRIRNNGEDICDFKHSDETPIRDLVWHPCVTLDEVGECATVTFMS